MMDNVTDLLAELAAHTPALPGALCRDHVDVFDSETTEAVEAAITICGNCPARAACERWSTAMDPRRLLGVVAGKHYSHDRRNPAPSAIGRTARR
ncbi:WhiB family transcriptional regulator [Mycolicibacterium pyrenivorans]|uniref:WhiB family transcriptional regulator n=1 Tax=Mycolicibacterium pyrenivorans TaxID=187102 RepID=UPI0021F2A0EE|nr:WhiB family transcriptional regulator [Mycolicibacterium pyrenivorans]MCV7150528.1 WhiB family transcriptional regulator [Mycolicibacterium pyrenivorans]